ncbi:TGF-beta-activated kinase 1 and MAP3K7-binding protein 3-like isoform X1 [Polyodon spathula]|uniref:TGF-beta-activated kinase 1 and MAP3K7-binding protein 3-like isoform X1 n=2 Tax=Polyodon spathula TaxID=7913 RepID=UPI001B7E4AF8|nr:TGF-beta-activated kinase 1 and MAP3K7-binding protein 3-like isoform X1 [Polyodon spathula]XP_041127893.1 TGF-beta-activated kinase 1 and MAP3K7-binding protein 3-like isoform X1 [Polyodon spathula]XP_041127894.1 TGF-beta-activated kinase 1 and MAP3K7-binding protein 3-like isoform X1 [Polyodon spathula]
MAQGSQQLDIQILHDLKHRFPEIPEGVVSQCMLQNNNNLEACCRALALESSKYLYGEYHSPEDTRMNRNHMLHINLGIHSATGYQAGDGAQTNGGRTLVHSSSDGHIDPQRGGGTKQQMMCLLQEPHSAPATVAPSPVYNPFFMNEQGCTASTPPPTSLPPGMSASAMQGVSPTYTPIPRYTMNPITVTLSQNIPAAPRALHLPSQIQNCPYATAGNAVFIRSASSQSPSGRQTPQSSPWHSPTAQCQMQPYNQQPHAIPVYQTQPSPYQPTPYSSKQSQMPQSAYHSPPPSQFPSPYSSPQHQIQPSQPCHQTSHVFMPISPPTMMSLPYQQQQHGYQQQGGQPVSFIPYLSPVMSKSSIKNQIEITLESPQRSLNRSSSPVTSQQHHHHHQQQQQRGQNTLYIAPSSPSRGISGGQMSMSSAAQVAAYHPGMYIHQGHSRPAPSPQQGGGGGAGGGQAAVAAGGPRARVTQPSNSTYTFKIKVSPGRPVQRQVESPTVETESILNLVEQGEHPGAPEPIQPISALPGTIGDRGSNKYRRKFSSGSDDYAYTQALLLHQRARMERLVKELHLEKQILEKLKTDVNGMEYDLMQRRFHRVNTTSLIPAPEDMTRLRSQNRQLQINIDCTLKEIDLLKSRGKFDPKALNNFYDHIQPGPVVPPEPSKKEPRSSSKPRRQPRDEDFEGAHWNCESCTFLNHPALNRCEQCEMPRYT